MAEAPDVETRLRRIVVPPGLPISEGIIALDRAGDGVLLLCDEDRRLAGVLTDGDIRRAIMRGVEFDRPCSEIASRDPLVAPPDTEPGEALHLMDRGRKWVVHHLPLVDGRHRVVNLLFRRDLVRESPGDLSAVIMAGGYGLRLRPLTDAVPKPMLDVGGRPLMQRTIERLREADIRRVIITTHHRSDAITEYFGDGRRWGVKLDYVTEDRPLGTAGALRLVDPSEGPILVINGDVLTSVNFRAMLDFHRQHTADMTVASRVYEICVPYGVVESNGIDVTGIVEKPVVKRFVNAGIYLMNPDLCRCIPEGRASDIPELIGRLIAGGRRVISFPLREYWRDIGRHSDYEQAQLDTITGAVA